VPRDIEIGTTSWNGRHARERVINGDQIGIHRQNARS
jgi:hypothetical protein